MIPLDLSQPHYSPALLPLTLHILPTQMASMQPADPLSGSLSPSNGLSTRPLSMSSENRFDDLSLSDHDEPAAPAPKTKLAPLAAVPTVEDDEEPVYVPDEPSPDPWRSPDPYAAASPTSRQPSAPAEAAASELGAPSRGKQRAEARSGDVPIILGVAVVDFNHLVS